MTKTLAALLLVLALASCSDSDGPAEKPEPPGTTAQASSGETRVLLRTQDSDSNQLTVESLVLAEPGFVAVFANEDGAPGENLGVSELLDAGVHKDVSVDIGEDRSGEVFVIVFGDTDGNGEFGWPVGDEPIGDDNGIVLVPITLD